MPSQLLFLADAYAKQCDAAVIGVRAQEGGGVGVLLDQTVFYAEGGGQPGDVGRIVWEGGAADVARTVKGADAGEVLHLLADGAEAPPVGGNVSAEIDWETRFARMRMHTALHLLSVVIPLPVTGGQIGDGKGRLDFDMPEAPSDKTALEARLNALIAENHPVTSEWISDAELEANPGLVKTMAVKPPMGQGRVRLVRIGAGDPPVDLQPCGGTHVAATGEIGAVRLGKVEKKGKSNRRVSLILG
ncbi:MAG: alanyl-tRNA editing protein [Neomegalonema sp.]|nr:alanyl-tRNA editing protein [Neomegalonema sp.]